MFDPTSSDKAIPGHQSTSGVPHRGAFVKNFVRPGESVFALFVFEVLAAAVTKFYSAIHLFY
jgi:hypothetical protein